MRNRNWLAFLIAPLAFLALLLVLGEYSVQAVPHPEYRRGGSYEQSVAVVWALDSIRDDVSCHDSLNQFQRKFGGLRGGTRHEVAEVYEDLVGHCDDHDPDRSARERARAYLRGMGVNR
ncbi:MAG: hypothetical protein ACRD4U_10555 [Candidatus Acidiferrales bacterium]